MIDKQKTQTIKQEAKTEFSQISTKRSSLKYNYANNLDARSRI